MQQLIIATGNQGKVKELKKLLAHLSFEILSLKDLPNMPKIIESGTTFKENAAIKAVAVSKYTQGIIIADDSGLEVDALGGEPGVYSARYAGEGARDAANNAKLLESLQGIPLFQRTAHFCCTIAIVIPGQEMILVEGYCNGLIAKEPRGDGGFGYDPLFVALGYDKTFAELPLEVKNKISHRSKAMAKALIILEKLWSPREKTTPL